MSNTDKENLYAGLGDFGMFDSKKERPTHIDEKSAPKKAQFTVKNNPKPAAKKPSLKEKFVSKLKPVNDRSSEEIAPITIENDESLEIENFSHADHDGNPQDSGLNSLNNENLLAQNRIKNQPMRTSFKHEQFEAMTARLDYEDIEILRALKSTIKANRKQYIKPDGVVRERLTENMILRSLVKCFTRHSLEHQSFNWSQINNEEDLFREISKSFKGIAKGGIHSHEI